MKGTRITPAYAGKSHRLHPDGRWCWDHPRVCGEKKAVPVIHKSCIGSPPRMRGKESAKFYTQDISRITPAYAGKSFRRRSSAYCPEDHPRVCGEKCGSESLHRQHRGSPPRMRGKGIIVDPSALPLRITPAYAGKSAVCPPILSSCRDHPRVCGEKQAALCKAKGKIGSPPRMRGKDIVVKGHSSKEGITPAYAGKSDS